MRVQGITLTTADLKQLLALSEKSEDQAVLFVMLLNKKEVTDCKISVDNVEVHI